MRSDATTAVLVVVLLLAAVRGASGGQYLGRTVADVRVEMRLPTVTRAVGFRLTRADC